MTSTILDLLTGWLSWALEQADREALCGDLAESGISGLSALRDVTSLAVRRKLTELADPWPWISSTLLAVPFGLLLSIVSGQTADGGAIFLWLYANNVSLDLVRLPGFWRDLAICLPLGLVPCCALAGSSWSAGLLIRFYARRTTWFSGGVLLAVLFAVGIFGAPSQLRDVMALSRGRDFWGNSPVFANAFYRSVFPRLVEALLVFVPLLDGMQRNLNHRCLARWGRMILFVAAAMSGGSLVSQGYLWPSLTRHSPSLAILAVSAPAAYLLLTAARFRNASQSAAHA
jgi:hypothetical protein